MNLSAQVRRVVRVSRLRRCNGIAFVLGDCFCAENSAWHNYEHLSSQHEVRNASPYKVPRKIRRDTDKNSLALKKRKNQPLAVFEVLQTDG